MTPLHGLNKIKPILQEFDINLKNSKNYIK